MWNVVKGLLGSKKFIAAIVGVIAAGAAKLGWSWGPDDILAVLSPVIAYILGQGVADVGKSKALPPAPPVAPV